jgi:hypothetical protein
MTQVRYFDGIRFVLAEPFEIQTAIRHECGAGFVMLSADGLLWINEGFAWDGASGPIDRDAPYTVRGSLVHDALYFLFRAGVLPLSWRDEADALMCELFEQDGMNPMLATAAYEAVRKWGAQYADPANARKVLVAPRPLQIPEQFVP